MAFLSIPRVQNTLFEKLLKKISAETHFSIQHKDFTLQWFQKILLTDFTIKDPNNQLVCSINQLKLHINPLQILWKRAIVINYLEIVGGQLQLIKGKEEATFNAQTLLARLIPDRPASIISPIYPKGFIVAKAFLKDFSVLVDDQTRSPISTGFDPYHVKVEHIAAELAGLAYGKDTLVGTVQQFTGSCLTQNLNIHKLHTKFKITPYATGLKNLHIHTDHSHLIGSLQVDYKDVRDYTNIFNQINIIAQLEELNLASQELAHFIPYFQGHTTAYKLKGRIVGRLSDFYLEDFYLEFGAHKSHVSGFASLQGLPNFDKAYFNLELTKSYLSTLDLLPHVDQQYHHILQRITFCRMSSSISGNLNHFLAKGKLRTDIGQITTNMEIAVDTATQEIAYKGEVNTEAFKAGKLLDIDNLQEVTMHAYIDGQGINPETASFYLRTHILKLGFHTYNYKNIRTDGRFAKAFFKGSLAIEDPNLVAHITTKIDYRNLHKEFFVKGLLTSVAFDKLGLIDKSAHLSSEISVTLQGTSWDNFTTDATFNRIQLALSDKPLYLDELHILNIRKDGYSTLTLNSNLLDIQAEGAIKYTALLHDLGEFIHAYQQRLVGCQTYIPTYTDKPYKFTYQLNLNDINPLLHVLAPNIYVAPHTSLQGVFTQQETVKFELHVAEADSLAFDNKQLQKSQWHVTALQNKDGKLLTATSKLIVSKQQWQDYASTENFVLDMNWINDEISFTNSIGDKKSDIELNLAGKATLKNASIHFSFYNTAIRLVDQLWNLHPASTISIHESDIKFHNILLSSEDQQISLEGKWSSIAPEKLVIGVTNLTLSSFPYFINRKIAGTIQGTLVLMSPAENPHISSDININGITINNLRLGDLYTKATWDNSTKSTNIVCQLKQAEDLIIHIAGSYQPTKRSQNLNLIADFSHAQLVLLEPFVASVFSQLKGVLDGRFHITGSLKTPHIEGRGLLKDVTFRFTYLNALYQAYGAINCSGNTIQVENLHLSDDQEGQGDLRGNIYHTYLKDFSLDLAGDMHKLKVLDTKYENNESFYGKGIVSGNITISGAIDNVAINTKVVTKKGTNLAISIQKHNEKVEYGNYIRFVDFKNSKKAAIKNSPSIQLKGISLYINLEITPDAGTEIILNRNNGDIIQSKGKGLLTIKSDPEGSINITGNYELVEGTYNFSLYEIVRKKFKILEGSSISWIDKSYDGILHVKAIYDQRTTLTPLLENIQAKKESTKGKRKYPISILLTLEGVLSAPNIQFDIHFQQLPEDPELQEAITTFQEKIATDKNYLKNQVFSLVMLKVFSSSNSLNVDKNALQRNVGEVFSQQLSSLASQLNENLEVDIDIDLEDLNQEKTTNLPVKISYNLLADRLIIARKSKINFAAGKEVDFANMAGDWSIEYGLTSDNRLSLKLHIYPSGSETSAAIPKSVFSAISFVYVKNFNSWRELFLTNKSKPEN